MVCVSKMFNLLMIIPPKKYGVRGYMACHNLFPTRTKWDSEEAFILKDILEWAYDLLQFSLDAYFSDANSPVHVTKEALQLYQTQFTARWEGLIGDDHIPRYVGIRVIVHSGSLWMCQPVQLLNALVPLGFLL